MKRILFSLAVLATSMVSSQVLIDDSGNTEAEIHESAALQINSNDKGVVLPRMFDAPANPTEGLMYYDQLSKCFKGFDGEQWYELGGKCELPPLSVNEFHYRGSGVNEFVELRAPKDADVSLNKLILINSGTPYEESMISEMTRLSDDNYDYYVWETTLQDGENNGFALMNGEEIVELVSYRGTFTYQGQESTDVGVAQFNSDQSGTSIQYIDGLGWTKTEGFNTKGFANSNVAPPSISFVTSEVSVEEGAQGETTNVNIEISLDSPATEDITLNFDYTGTADAIDYTAPTSLLIPSGASSAILSINIIGDNEYELDETLLISLSSVEGRASIDSDNNIFTLTILNDDAFTGSVLLDEDFSEASGSDNTGTNQSSAWIGNENFPTLLRVYEAGGAIKLGSGSGIGSIESNELSTANKNVTVSFDVKGWTNVEGKIIVTINGVSKDVTYVATRLQNFESKSVTFENVSANSSVKIATSAKRAFIDNVVVSVD